MDNISAASAPPLLLNGMLTLAGKDTSVMTNLDTFDLNIVQNYSVNNPQSYQNMAQYIQLDAFQEPFAGAFP
jgi:hypothetical protein